jgi:hypothetical protein
MNNEWTNLEFQTYVLLYAAHCNYIETEEERNYILSKVDEETFNKIHNEIVNDDEFEATEKIKNYIQYQDFSETQKDELLRDIKQVFFADGSVDVSEKKVFLYLKKILK